MKYEIDTFFSPKDFLMSQKIITDVTENNKIFHFLTVCELR